MRIINVKPENAAELGIACVKNQKHEGFGKKRDWFKKRFREGLRLQLLHDTEAASGMIEYVPAEFAWRPVHAPGYMFIQCIWVYPKKNQGKDYGSSLIQTCISDAKQARLNGVVAFASDGPWLADRRLFENNGFKLVDSKGRFDLMVYPLKKAAKPEFVDWEKNQKKYQGLNLVYAAQCPYIAKVVEELVQTAKANDYELKLTELKTARQAQNAPSGYGTFSLLYNGRLLEDHYISKTRFKNILTREINRFADLR